MSLTIRILTKADGKALRDMKALIAQLRADKAEHGGTLADLREIISDKHAHMAVAKDGTRIVGMATLYILQKIGMRSGQIEDVVVDNSYRGQGLGEKIMRLLIAHARAKKVTSLNLTSRADRVAGNAMYKKLGFEKKDTNVYRLTL